MRGGIGVTFPVSCICGIIDAQKCGFMIFHGAVFVMFVACLSSKAGSASNSAAMAREWMRQAMKIVRKLPDATHRDVARPRVKPWKLQVVDDEPDVRQLIVLNLREQTDIVLVLIYVVMQADDAGLKLAAFIRDKLRNAMVRLVIRTGQPGLAPERHAQEQDSMESTICLTSNMVAPRTGWVLISSLRSTITHRSERVISR